MLPGWSTSQLTQIIPSVVRFRHDALPRTVRPERRTSKMHQGFRDSLFRYYTEFFWRTNRCVPEHLGQIRFVNTTVENTSMLSAEKASASTLWNSGMGDFPAFPIVEGRLVYASFWNQLSR
jgi:hypothetical protein